MDGLSLIHYLLNLVEKGRVLCDWAVIQLSRDGFWLASGAQDAARSTAALIGGMVAAGSATGSWRVAFQLPSKSTDAPANVTLVWL
jgi:hypothetical protein